MVIALSETGWSAVATGAVGLLALMIAIFQEPLRQRWNRARLRVDIRAEPPDVHLIAMTATTSGQFVSNALYVRARVEHVGGGFATNVELIVTSVRKLERDGSVVPKPDFLPLPLVWSHFQPRTSSIRVPSSLFRHCDVGHFVPAQDGSTLFVFDTLVQPNPVASGEIPNVLRLPGDYEIEVLLSGDNTNTIRKRWVICVPPKWSDDERTMLKSVRIRSVHQGQRRRALSVALR